MDHNSQNYRANLFYDTRPILPHAIALDGCKLIFVRYDNGNKKWEYR